MAVLLGIDEAGYGPLLGPLVVSGVAFRVPDDRIDACLWDTLKASCARRVTKSGRKLAVADSKKLFRSRQTLGLLERAALVMLAASGHRPRTLREMLGVVAPEATADLDRIPWYAARDVPLPSSDEVGDIDTRANKVRRDAESNRVAMLGVYCEPLTADRYNRLVAGTRNKAVVALGMALRIIDLVTRSAGEETVRVCVDRQGGRTHYRESLMTAMPDCELQIIEESPERSAYQLVAAARRCRIEFVAGGEEHHFVVALASVYSKYLRELYMRLFNGFWCEAAPDLRPTAGYYTDAPRWLGDADEVIRRLSVDRRVLVRDR